MQDRGGTGKDWTFVLGALLGFLAAVSHTAVQTEEIVCSLEDLARVNVEQTRWMPSISRLSSWMLTTSASTKRAG